jgi:cellulose synthase/poly-beta-1,6-N-acetylglucosamine synthase-like glycosyltransferase
MITIYLTNAYYIFQLIILILLILAILYIFIFSVAGLFYNQRISKLSVQKRRIAVLIPGFKEDEVIIEVATESLMQSYPRDLFDVIIIADSFQPQTVIKLNKLHLKVLEVSFEKSTKSKALNKALEQLPERYDIAVVLDADNIMAFDFLEKINACFDENIIAVQGHRTAKNLNTNLAVLDAVSEEINNHIFRKGHRVLGLSSAIIGSGMAFNYQYFKDLMSNVNAIGGFDKEIELKILKAGYKIEYVHDAYVYDEKVQKADAFTNQRKRWISAQLHYFRKDIGSSLFHLITKGNVDYFDKAIQFIQPPRILLLGAIIISTIGFTLTNYLCDIHQKLNIIWFVLLIICILTFLFSIPKKFYNLSTAKALLELPKGMILMLVSLLKIKGANKQFLHTKHTTSNTK